MLLTKPLSTFLSNSIGALKRNHHIFALFFEQPIQDTVIIAEQLATYLDQKTVEINAYKTGTDSKVYHPKLNIGITPLAPAYIDPDKHEVGKQNNKKIG